MPAASVQRGDPNNSVKARKHFTVGRRSIGYLDNGIRASNSDSQKAREEEQDDADWHTVGNMHGIAAYTTERNTTTHSRETFTVGLDWSAYAFWAS